MLKKREEEGEEAELSDEEEEEEEEPEEVAESQEEEGKPKGPSPVLQGFYYGTGREFWLSMVSASAAGYVCMHVCTYVRTCIPWRRGGGAGASSSKHLIYICTYICMYVLQYMHSTYIYTYVR